MKVLLVSVKSDVSRGGIAVWTKQYMEHCEKHGMECFLVNTEAVGLRAVQGTARRRLSDEFSRTIRIFRDLSQQIRSNSMDAAHLNTSCGNFGLFRDYLIARRIKKAGIPLVVHYHCDIPFWIRNSFSRICLGALVRTSDENLVLCTNSQEYLNAQFGIHAKKIPNFIDDSVVIKTPPIINEQIKRIFFSGRVSIIKGAVEIFETAKQFPKITFELAGEVTQEVEALQKPDNVNLLGMIPHTEIISRLSSADLFLLPSHSEGFSLSLLESMARGVPAIASNVGANADMLSDHCGIVIKCGDMNAISDAIDALASQEIRQDISKHTIQKVKRQYTVDTVLNTLKSIYCAIAS